MPYNANAVKVMIASPGDVSEERDLIRTIIAEWNATNSEAHKVVLMPVGWDSHAAPEMGDRPQAIINKRLLKGCDILVAVFWTRIGTSTGEAISGTVEEIQKHLNAGKRAMVYFSLQPVVLDSVEPEQVKAVRDFKKNCESMGLVEKYDDLSEFRIKFTRQLAQTVLSGEYGTEAHADSVTLLQLEDGNVESDARQLIADLSDQARIFLVEAAKDQHGTLLKTRSSRGLQVQANRQVFDAEGSAREMAVFEGAIESLCSKQLLNSKGHRGEVFMVTDKGYDVADLLRAES